MPKSRNTAKNNLTLRETNACRRRPSKNRSSIRVKRSIAIVGGVFVIAVIALMLSLRPAGRRICPMHYKDEVFRIANEYELDPCLVFAVIKVESDFVPDAVSRAGAQGLMQLMPDTADWVAWRQGRVHDCGRILEPAYNIDMGCYLLEYLLEYYDGNLDYALAAYNAGKGAVDGWLENSEYFDGKTLRIPYEETDNYVKKVNLAYKIYKELYNEETTGK